MTTKTLSLKWIKRRTINQCNNQKRSSVHWDASSDRLNEAQVIYNTIELHWIVPRWPSKKGQLKRHKNWSHVLDGWTFSMSDVLRSANFFSTLSRSVLLDDAPNDVSLLMETVWDVVGGSSRRSTDEADVAETTFGESAFTTAPTAFALLIFCV